ncbi:hAD superfamily (Subfamily IIIA) phosphatase TIGR01668 [Clostridium sp. CAG:575]|nr:hAD superfamily (Subfamily IIIA) phosphatase TIGR01668 [Clostridium sp. CAG:575]
MKKIYPNLYLKKVEDITIEQLLKNKIKALILDVDNTLIDINKNLSEDIVFWAKQMKGQGIKLYILSNTNDKKKVETIAQKLDIPYKHFALKPLKKGFKFIQKELKINPENIGVVGDQIFTDVLGGNRNNMFTILVEPINNQKDYWYTAWKRPIENKIKNKIKANEEKNKNVY